MKKTELSVRHHGAAIIAMLLAGPAAAQTSVTLYGVLDAGVELSSAGKGTVTRVISGGQFASRWGLTGSEDLGDGLRAIFRLESGFNSDDGTLGQGGRAFGREASVGLSHATLGTLTLGRVPTPYYLGTAAADAFGCGHAGGLLALTRSGTTSQQLLPLLFTARNDNAVNYVSPSLQGVELRFQVAAGEGQATMGRAYGASARYTRNEIDAVLSYGLQDGAGNVSGRIRAISAGGSYNLGPAKVFAAYVDEKNDCRSCTGGLARVAGVGGIGASEFRVTSAGVRVPVSLPLTIIGQVARVADRSVYAADMGDRSATWVAVGAEYQLSKRSLIYASAGTIGNAHGSQYVLGTGLAQQPAGVAGSGDYRARSMAMGIRTAF